jgi:hypothetical protein
MQNAVYFLNSVINLYAISKYYICDKVSIYFTERICIPLINHEQDIEFDSKEVTMSANVKKILSMGTCTYDEYIQNSKNYDFIIANNAVLIPCQNQYGELYFI